MKTVMMRFISTFATMFVVASAVGNDDGTLDRFEVLVVGEEVGKPYSTIDSLDPLTVVSFFEVHPKRFEDDPLDKYLTVEIFANAPKDQDDCSKGVLLENVIDTDNGFTIETQIDPFPNYNEIFKDIGGDTTFPQTQNGKVGAAKFTISDYEYYSEGSGKQIYFKDRGIDGGGGTIEFCVRVSIKLDYNDDGKDDYVSHFDSFKTVNIDLAATFASFEGLDVDIDSTGATNFVSVEEKTVEINSFLCDDNNNPVDASKSYSIGKNFRICVGTKDTEDGNIKVKDFKSLVCGKDDRKRQLIFERKALPLTEVDDEADSNGVLGVESVITDGFAVAGEVTSTISCKGKVMLKYGPLSCIELCNIKGNRGEVIPAETNMRELIYDYYHSNTEEDIKEMYGNDINCWDISLVTSLDNAFRNLRDSKINRPLNCWNTEGITSMSSMFNGASAFNQDLSMWKVNSVTNMYQMFLLGTIFNQDLSAWDVSSVSDMTQMFYMATSFNQDLSMWKVNNVKKTHQMFYQAAIFNQDLSTWDVTSVTDMRAMFHLAKSFNQNLCKWSYPPNSRNFVDIFLDTACENQNHPTKSAACQSCSRRHLDINNKIKNNNNNNRNNNRILQQIGGRDTVAPFVTTINFSTTVNDDSAAATPFYPKTVIITTFAAVTTGFITTLMVM